MAKVLEWSLEMLEKLWQQKEKFAVAPIQMPPHFDLDSAFQLTTF